MTSPVPVSPASAEMLAPALSRCQIHYCGDRLVEPLSDGEIVAAIDLIQGLQQTPPTIPARYFYDDRGSELFEQICKLPEYYLTRTETAIFQQDADQIPRLTGPCELVELGSGSSTKTRLLLNAYRDRGYPLRYLPLDVSAGMLEVSAKQLLTEYSSLEIYGLAGTYEQGLAALPAKQLPTRLIAFIGSSLGNLNPTECDRFLGQIAAALEPQDYFLLGVDLQKPVDVLEAAYNDRQGVTAAFNLNMLRHLNWRYDGNFEVTQFQHRAIYNPVAHQIEMYLDSLTDQAVRLEALDVELAIAAGASIRTEISRKFHPVTIAQTLERHGFQVRQHFTDTQQWFGVFLCQRRSPQDDPA